MKTIPNEEIISKKYLLALLKAPLFQTFILSVGVRAAQAGFNKDDLSKFHVFLPSLDNQKRIAKVLSDCETLIQKRKDSIELLDEFLKSTFLEMFGDPLNNSRNWEIGAVSKFGNVITGSTPSGKKEGMYGNEIPFITPGDLESNEPIKRYLTKEGATNSRTVRAGATLVCCIGATIGKVGRAKTLAAFNQQLNGIEWFEGINDYFGEYLFRLLKPLVINKGTSSTLPILNKGDFQKIRVINPPIYLQNQFAHIVGKIEILKHNLSLSELELENLYGSLSQKAFKGELDLSKVELNELGV